LSLRHSREPCKTDEPIEMPFGLWTRVGPTQKELCIRRGPDPPWKEAILRGEGAAERPIVKYREYPPCAAAMRPFVKLL